MMLPKRCCNETSVPQLRLFPSFCSQQARIFISEDGPDQLAFPTPIGVQQAQLPCRMHVRICGLTTALQTAFVVPYSELTTVCPGLVLNVG